MRQERREARPCEALAREVGERLLLVVVCNACALRPSCTGSDRPACTESDDSAALVTAALAARWLARDLRAHPANFPERRVA
jgi:hypothetical protein